jgi:FtsP/CotA-like multicopper oxidase with cupredoxin domain
LLGRFRSPVLGGDAGDIAYPLHLLNGRPSSDAPTLSVPPGGRARLRIINAAAETAYRVGWPGLTAVVTHSDGFPVEPVPAEGLLIGMGERYDVVVTVPSGAWPFVAGAEGKGARGGAVLRTTDAAPSTVDLEAAPLPTDGALLTYDRLRAVEAVRLDFDEPDAEHVVTLTGRAANYHWGIEGLPYPDNTPLVVHPDEKVRLVIENTTNMWHPIHLHGHTFRLGTAPDGPRKDTVIVKPGESPVFDVVCDNPGRWMLHCHNAYHLEAGMAIGVDYHR